MVIWIMGLSGSGKTTLAKMLIQKLKKEKENIIHVDGDIIRNIHNDKLGHSIKDREINAERISKLVKFLSKQKIFIVVSVLSNFPKWLKWNKNNIDDYFQIYIKSNFQDLKKRKPKLYKKKINVVGKDIKFNEPKNSDYEVENYTNKAHLKKEIKKILTKIKFYN